MIRNIRRYLSHQNDVNFEIDEIFYRNKEEIHEEKL